MGCGIGIGGAFLTLAQLVLALPDVLDRAPDASQLPNPLDIGLWGAILIAALLAVRRSWALENLWQAGVIGVLAAFGALLVGFVGAPIYRLAGIPGLVVWTALAAVFGAASSRWSVRGSRGETLSAAEREALHREHKAPPQ